MKKLLLNCFCLATVLAASGQTPVGENSCSEALTTNSISADVTYSIGSINGEEASFFCVGNGNNVTGGEWVKYTANEDINITVSSDLIQNDGKDTRVQIYTGSCNALTCVGGDDDDGDGFLSIVQFAATAGTTYLIVWDDRWNNSSNFDFILTEGDITPPPSDSPITFTQSAISAPGSYDLGLVDMNGDFLDDPVSVSSSRIYVNYQLPESEGGGFNLQQLDTETARFLPGWSLTAADFDGNGYNDLMYGSGSGVSFMQANDNLAEDVNGNYYSHIVHLDPEDLDDEGNPQPYYVFSQRGNFADINVDGHLDAFMCHDVAPSVSFMNDGSNNLEFTNTNGLGNYGSGGNYASIWVDYDNDGDIDMFMAKCGGTGDRPKNQLFRNEGYVDSETDEQVYTNISDDPGVNLWDGIQTWSSAWGDLDNDGDMDIYIGSSTGSNHKVMKNNTKEREDNPSLDLFVDVTSGAGVSLSAATGHENIAHDFDNDGNLDLYSNGVIFFGNGDLTFNAVTDLNLPPGYGGAIGDLNNDGYLDLFASGSIYTNNKETENNWIKVVTVGKSYTGTPNRSNRNGIGARVEIKTASGYQIRDVKAGEGFKYCNTLNTHFGIGTDDAIEYIKVIWPSGEVDQINSPSINDTLVINESDFTLSINQSLVDNLILHPNPTKDILNLNSTLGFANDAFYSVFDINGKRVLNAKLNSETIDVSNLNSGNYILRIVSGNDISSQKFIKY